MQNYIDTELKYGAKNYAPLPVVLARGAGVYVWDVDGKPYMDMMSAYSAVSHGHCHPRLVSALQQQAQTLAVVSRAFYSNILAGFLHKICLLTKQDKALPMNSGAEAVETALKAARKWAYTVKNVAPDKAEIIVCSGNFHGRTIAIVGMSDTKQYQKGFGPFAPGFRIIPYGDVAALGAAITKNTAAFLVEPIQGEAGIRVPSQSYLKECAQVCKNNKVLLICDEIQTGMGRTGKFLATEHAGIVPDGVLLGKALGGGLLPISLFLTKQEVMDVFTPGDHGSTFGGNPLAAHVGSVAIDVLLEENLIENSARLGEYFIRNLKKIKSKLITNVRGKGLLIGIEIDKRYSAHAICLDLLAEGILTKETHSTVIRLAPPLIINQSQIETALDILIKVFKKYESN